ncbi:MAG: DNRLRE domain-containing protein [Candidatus Aegiribacteria sp.]|nr:DNRLRE domain-containing protein [Candidatus Aegiribacteria sp.]
MFKNTVLTVFILVIFTGITIADSVTLCPTDDADVWEYTPDTNRGSEISFQVGCGGSGYWRNSLIKFDLSAYSGATVNSAILRLWVTGSYGDFPTDNIFIVRNDADWDELTVTWNNKPTSAGIAPITAPSTYDWWEIDVTGWVQDFVDGSFPNYGFQILQNDTDYAIFSMGTKEGPIDPELVLDFVPVSLEHTTFGRIKSLFD